MTFQVGSPEHLAAFQRRPKADQLTPEEREKLVSIHEASHACYLVDSGFVVDRATIISEPSGDGHIYGQSPVMFENFHKACIVGPVARTGQSFGLKM